MICMHARPSELEKMGAPALSHLVIAQMGRIEQLELLVAKREFPAGLRDGAWAGLLLSISR